MNAISVAAPGGPAALVVRRLAALLPAKKVSMYGRAVTCRVDLSRFVVAGNLDQGLCDWSESSGNIH
jgi:hypothetical protein